jgi:hypothetical protein
MPSPSLASLRLFLPISAVLVASAVFACDRDNAVTAAPTEEPSPAPTEPAIPDDPATPTDAPAPEPAPASAPGLACASSTTIPADSCASQRCADVPAEWTSCSTDADCRLVTTAEVKCRNQMPYVSVSSDHVNDAHRFKENGSCGCETARAVCIAGICGVADS